MVPELYIPQNEVSIYVNSNPVKNENRSEVDLSLVEKQAYVVASKLISVEDYFARYGTCPDGRGREGTLEGQPTDARFQMFGGPVVYVVNLRSLLSPEITEVNAKDSFESAVDDLIAAGFKPGMHTECAALNNIQPVMQIISNEKNKDMLYDYAKQSLGDRFKEEYADIIINSAGLIVDSAKFNGFSDNVLHDILTSRFGEVETNKSIEKLLPVEHKELTVGRVKRPNTAVDTTAIFDLSVYGEGTYIINDPYAKALESFVASGPDATTQSQMAEHARELIIRATLQAVPNPVLTQFDIR